jgi:hypothetical protein
MARTNLTVIEITRTGVDLATTLEAGNADGEMFYNGGDVLLAVENLNAADCTVTVVSPRTVDGLAVSDLTVVVSQDEVMLIGPFPRDTFNQPSGDDAGKVYVNLSHVDDLKVAALRLA